jgi:hypothetical protein
MKMKTTLLIALLFFFNFKIIAQVESNVPPLQYAPQGNEIPISFELNEVSVDSNDCLTEAYIEFTFNTVLKSSGDYSFNDYYYSFIYEVVGISSNETEQVLTSQTVIPSNYNANVNGNYVYSFNILDGSIDLDAYPNYSARLKVRQHVFNNDPGLGMYVIFTPTTFSTVNFKKCDNIDDRDGDGIPDNIDNCPDHPNPDQSADMDNDGIGDICDTVDNRPNLKLKKLHIKANNKTYKAFPENEEILFQKEKLHTFTVGLENNGGGSASPSEVSLLVSDDINAYPVPTNGTQAYQLLNFNLGSIDAGSSKELSLEYFIFNNILGLTLTEGSTYYLFVDVDAEDKVDEIDDSLQDNFIIFPFKFNDTSNDRFAYIDFGDTTNTKVFLDYYFDSGTISNMGGTQQLLNPTHNIKLYSLNTGTMVYDNDIAPNTVIDLSSLPQGTYAIHVNNVYLKKVIKTTGGSTR